MTVPVKYAVPHRFAALVAIVWTLSVGGSLGWNVYNTRQQTLDTAKNEALANFNKDQAFRAWATKYGGVYVPPTKETPPNHYLSHIPDRDITLPSGKRLTLMNPAYMLRELMTDYGELYGIKGHITSLNALNPLNAPDPWEQEALRAFERGAKEVSEIVTMGGKTYLRLMRPMVAQKACLKCHAHQGYKEGDIRGGVGVAFPLTPLIASEHRILKNILFTHAVIWLLGMGGIGFVAVRSKARARERADSETAIRTSEERFRNLVETTNDWVWEVDKNGVYTFASPAVLYILGYGQDEVLGRTPFDFMQPEEADRVSAIFGTLVAEHKPIDYLENVNLHKDGSQIVLETCGRPFFGMDGTFLGYRGVDRDITMRKKAEEDLRRRAQELAALLKASQSLATSLDLNNVLQTFINGTVEVTGLGTGAIYLLEGEKLYLWATTPPLPAGFPEELRRTQLADHPHIKQAILTRVPVVMADTATADLTPAEKAISEMRDLRSLLYVPLIGREKVTGVFIVGSVGEPREITQDMINMSRTMANQAVLAIDNAQLYEDIIRHAATLEDKVRERTAELEAKIAEIERMNKLFVGRELRMVELKERVKTLEQEVEKLRR